MNMDQLQSMMRQILTAAGSIAITAFHASPDAVGTYAGAASVLASIGWSLITHKNP